jgi:hypothetical protein
MSAAAKPPSAQANTMLWDRKTLPEPKQPEKAGNDVFAGAPETPTTAAQTATRRKAGRSLATPGR